MMRSRRAYRCRGFTLIEVLLALAVLAIAGGALVPLYQGTLASAGASTAALTYEQALRQAANYAAAGKEDSSWGVYITSGSIVVFAGESYAVRDQIEDVSYDIANSLTISGVDEVVFAHTSALPGVTGTSTFTMPSGDSAARSINSYGTISTQ